ncbi:hypothetical protein [Streptomyces sp. NPDC006925]|uniref:hypothetical protein n=1 Tax=Streptomyces sp. NPDC006925 TaxID=3364768 RepID=UPI0036755556
MPSMMPGQGGAELVDDLGAGSKPHSAAVGAAPLGKQRSHLTDGQGRDGGAVDAEPAGRHIVRAGVTEAREVGQETVDEHQRVPRIGAHRLLCTTLSEFNRAICQGLVDHFFSRQLRIVIIDQVCDARVKDTGLQFLDEVILFFFRKIRSDEFLYDSDQLIA